MSSSQAATAWGKYYSKSKKLWYYHNKVSKATFWTENDLPYGWAFIWEANSKKYFNVITNQTVGSKGEIPHETTKKKGNVDGISANSSPSRELLEKSKAIEDIPYISALRHEFILNIRETFANFIESNGSLPGNTKTARAVKKEGAFVGLAGLYVRWVFNQKRDEGDTGEDPLLPSVAAVDLKYLPAELVEAGFPEGKAIVATNLLTNEARKYVKMLQEERIKTNIANICNKYEDTTLKGKIQEDTNAKLIYLDFVDAEDRSRQKVFRSGPLKISSRHFEKLCQMYKRHHQLLETNGTSTTTPSQKHKKNKMLQRVFNVLQRYESLSGAAAGYQMALTEDIFDELYKLYGVEHECFASPLNAYFPNYCSLFYDTDKYFGSHGSFFNFFPKQGSFEANPPFVEATMTRNVQHITHLLSTSNLPLSFVIVVPGWDDDECLSYKLSISSPYLRQHVILSKNNHQYKSGAQYRVDDLTRYKDARIRTFVFVMQNEAGAKKWPATDKKREVLMQQFEVKSHAREREGHATMWQSKREKGSIKSVALDASARLSSTVVTSSKKKRAYSAINDTNSNGQGATGMLTAEDHYNNKKLRQARSNISNRENHSLTFWYKFSNWCKQCLIQGHSFPHINQISVLDLACGHGGDIFKYKRLNNIVHYVGADIAKESLLQAINKISTTSLHFSVRFGKVNLGTDFISGPESKVEVFNSKTNRWTPNTKLVQQQEKFHLVSMQFAFHYMMQSEERLRRFFESFTPHLMEGHFFVATTTDAHTMVQELSKQPPTNLETGETDIYVVDESNRVNCRITFPKRTREALLSHNQNGDDPSLSSSFGLTIHFKLTEHRDDGEAISAVNATEWLIPIETVAQIAAEYNLVLVMNTRFDQFLHRFCNHNMFGPLLSKMKVSGLREHEWKLARFYTALAFKKVPKSHRVAIIVPFRDLHVAQNRAKHLQQFIPYMVNFLSQTNTSFKVFVIEQSNDGKKFNRGKLLNVGYKLAVAEGYNIFIYHDVDLLPSKELQPWYIAYPQHPIHIARVWSRYNANPNYCGGIISWNKEDFQRINGFPNNFWGWGGEDDEMMLRMKEIGLKMQSPTTGSLKDLEYMTLEEKLAFLKKQKDGARDNKWKCMVKEELLKEHSKTWKSNGLSNLDYTKEKEIVLHESNLAVKVTVKLPLNNHWSDTKTQWGDLPQNAVRKPNASFASQWAGANSSSDRMETSANALLNPLIDIKEHSKGVPTVRTRKQLHALFTQLRKAYRRVSGGIVRDRQLLAYMKETSVNGSLNDDEVYTQAHEFYWKDREIPKESQTELNSGGKGFDRFGDRAQTIKELVENSIGPAVQLKTMLDVGCAEGGITANVGRALGLKPENVHGCDVRQVKKEDDGFQFLKYDGTTLPKSNYSDNSFGVVTCLMALHHMVLQQEIICSIYRVLKPGGVCIIREHDCSEDSRTFDGEIALAIDIQHSMYARVLSNPVEWPTFCSDYYAKYRARDTWTRMFLSAGFQRVENVRPDLYRAHGKSNWYWAVYRKKE